MVFERDVNSRLLPKYAPSITEKADCYAAILQKEVADAIHIDEFQSATLVTVLNHEDNKSCQQCSGTVWPNRIGLRIIRKNLCQLFKQLD